MDNNQESEELSLLDIDDRRDPEEKVREGKSGNVKYEIEQRRSEGSNLTKGKVIEVGEISDSKHKDLRKLVDEGYTHYAIFRLEDRSTTTIVQDRNDKLFKVYSFSMSDVKVSNRVTITVFNDQ